MRARRCLRVRPIQQQRVAIVYEAVEQSWPGQQGGNARRLKGRPVQRRRNGQTVHAFPSGFETVAGAVNAHCPAIRPLRPDIHGGHIG